MTAPNLICVKYIDNLLENGLQNGKDSEKFYILYPFFLFLHYVGHFLSNYEDSDLIQICFFNF